MLSYSLAKRSSRDDSFSIHPLVHSWAKLRLEVEPQKDIEIVGEAVEIIASAVHGSDKQRTEEWIFQRRIMPHLDAVTKHMTKYVGVSNIQDQARILGNVYRRHGRYNEALEWYTRALIGYEKVLGADHPGTLTMVNQMASIFENQGQYDIALEWCGRALVGYEKTLGSDHPDTLTMVNQMASIFANQGQYGKALEWYGRVLARREKALGAGHPLSQTTIRCLIDLHERTGHTEQAQSLRTRLYVPDGPSN